MASTTMQEGEPVAQRIRDLETRNAQLETVLEAAKRLLRTRSRLDDPFLMQLDDAVNTLELQAKYA